MEVSQDILAARKSILERAQQAKREMENPSSAPTKARIIVKVLPNSLEATLLLHPSSHNTMPPTKEDIMAALAEHNITYGINMELIEDLCVKPIFYHVFVIARGAEAKKGRNGALNYLVNNTADHAPVIREDGVADYKNINFFRVVTKGQPLCEIVPPEKGEDGVDIHGNVIEGKYGEDPFDPAGRNTEYNEDGTLLLASIDGHITVTLGKINVVEVLKVESGVNNNTGNIEFTGDVIVSGDVASGFSIKSGGSILIHGSVEGATLEAGTDIKVQMGMSGMDKGSVSAGGDIKCKYIQNCTVKATGNVYADSILFSDVECDGDLVLEGSKGALIGGHTTVAGKVLAKTIGSPLNAPTEVTVVNLDRQTEQLARTLEEKVQTCNSEIQKIIRTLVRYEDSKDKMSNKMTKELMNATDRYRECLTQREMCERQLQEIREKQLKRAEEGRYIQCSGKVYTNTTIAFGTTKMHVDDTITHSRFYPDIGGINYQRINAMR